VPGPRSPSWPTRAGSMPVWRERARQVERGVAPRCWSAPGTGRPHSRRARMELVTAQVISGLPSWEEHTVPLSVSRTGSAFRSVSPGCSLRAGERPDDLSGPRRGYRRRILEGPVEVVSQLGRGDSPAETPGSKTVHSTKPTRRGEFPGLTMRGTAVYRHKFRRQEQSTMTTTGTRGRARGGLAPAIWPRTCVPTGGWLRPGTSRSRVQRIG